MRRCSLSRQVQAKSVESVQSPRARVFVSMLIDLKNNKHKVRDDGEGPLSRLQKTLRQLAGGTEPPPFNVKWDELVEVTTPPPAPARLAALRLAQLLQADEKGRWWLVGSAWAGRSSSAARDSKASNGDRGSSREEKLVGLARAQRMNTQVRSSIFVAIMG